ncbi:hypothetical protein ABZ297_19720 [Nonomuraea sp. NPDC005983]|uniref:hypothetical protein n=1 Tax=Nonomuraea sp. NPDC005983 TaxID=3155595 RepID=UPI0033B46DB3
MERVLVAGISAAGKTTLADGRRSRETVARAAHHPEVTVIRLRTARDARRWLARL